VKKNSSEDLVESTELREELRKELMNEIKAKEKLTGLMSIKKEKRSFLNMKKDLVENKTYNNKFIAILNGKIVDFDVDNRKLAKRVYEKYGYIPIYIDKVEKETKTFEISTRTWMKDIILENAFSSNKFVHLRK
jgi:hypothetical protein